MKERMETTATRYPGLTEVLASEYADLPAERLEELFDEWFDGMSPEDLEGFMNIVRSVGKVAQKALPGVIKGATAGAALGPYGALIGGVAGGALGAAGGGARPPSGARPARPRVAARGRGAVGSPTAARLLQLIQRPEIQQALMSMVLGSAGKRNLPVGGTSVPVGAFTNLLGVLSNQAAAEYHALTAGETDGAPLYLLDEAGEFVCDPVSPVERAEVLASLLEGAAVQELNEEAQDEGEVAEDDFEGTWEGGDAWEDEEEWADEDVDAMYDAVDLAELYAENGW